MCEECVYLSIMLLSMYFGSRLGYWLSGRPSKPKKMEEFKRVESSFERNSRLMKMAMKYSKRRLRRMWLRDRITHDEYKTVLLLRRNLMLDSYGENML